MSKVGGKIEPIEYFAGVALLFKSPEVDDVLIRVKDDHLRGRRIAAEDFGEDFAARLRPERRGLVAATR